jgi:hypothetical protein
MGDPTAILRRSVALLTQSLTRDELTALDLCARLDSDPRGREFDYAKVKRLFTEDGGTRMHDDMKRALAAVVAERLNEE